MHRRRYSQTVLKLSIHDDLDDRLFKSNAMFGISLLCFKIFLHCFVPIFCKMPMDYLSLIAQREYYV